MILQTRNSFKPRSFRFSYIIGFLIIISNSILPSNTGKLAGVILDSETDGGIVAVNVIVKETLLGTITDEEGHYFVLNISPGSYDVVFSHIGYHSVTVQNVKISSDYTTEVSIDLRSTTLEGEEITVLAERSLYQGDFTATRSIMSAKEIESIPTENVTDLLKLQTGMVVGSDGLFHLRGGRGSEIGYFVDGIDMTDPYSSEFSSVELNTTAIQEISVVSGTYNAEYGQALSGIVNLLTKSGDPNNTSFGLSLYSGDYFSSSPIYINLDKITPNSILKGEGFVSGPLPFTKGKLTYFLSGKINSSDGWLYGQRIFLPKDSSDFSPLDPAEWYVEASGDSNFVPMNPYLSFNLVSKVSANLGQKTKLHISYLANNRDFQIYNHPFKYNPDGNYKRFRRGSSTILALSHSLSSRAFINLKVSSVLGRYKYYVFDDPQDEGYVSPDLFNMIAYNFYTGGTGMWHFDEQSKSLVAQWDITAQIGNRHQVKTGIGVNAYDLSLKEYELTLDESTDWKPKIPDQSAPNHNRYSHNPFEWYAYLQDKIEFQGLVMNLGLRLEHFFPDGAYPSDLRDPQGSERFSANESWQISPRFGMAYPITDSGILHVSYGHFFQVPPFKYLYLNPEFEVEPGVLTSIIGNTALKPQKAIAYEIGVQQQISEFLSIDLTTYNKDITNLIGSNYHQLYDISRKYTRYINRDYGNVKGVSLILKGGFGKRPIITFNTGYTYQIAEGNASDPNALFYDLRATPPRETEKSLIFLDWDERHTFSSSFSVTDPEKWHLGFTFSVGSGMPYTPEYQNQRTSFENSGRKPIHFNMDGQFSWKLPLGNFSPVFFAKVYNLTDNRNETVVFTDTGRAGYSLIPQYVPDNRYFSLDDYLNRPDFFAEPRRIMIGIRVQL